MAKSKKMELPTVDEAPVGGVEQLRGYDMAAEMQQTAAIQPVTVVSRQLSVPLANVSFGYLRNKIYLRKLTAKQSGALRQLQEALCIQGVRLADGSPIKHEANAIKWLLELVATT